MNLHRLCRVLSIANHFRQFIDRIFAAAPRVPDSEILSLLGAILYILRISVPAGPRDVGLVNKALIWRHSRVGLLLDLPQRLLLRERLVHQGATNVLPEVRDLAVGV